jgi:hypothetical protein
MLPRLTLLPEDWMEPSVVGPAGLSPTPVFTDLPPP